MEELIILDLSTKGIGAKNRLMAKIRRSGCNEFEHLWNRPIKNKIVDTGLQWMAHRHISDTPAILKYGAIGTGSTAATASDTGLESQILTRDDATLSTDTTAVTGDTAKWVATFTSDTNSYAVTEYATFETAAGGNAYNRVTFAAITLNLNDVLEMTLTSQMTEV